MRAMLFELLLLIACLSARVTGTISDHATQEQSLNARRLQRQCGCCCCDGNSFSFSDSQHPVRQLLDIALAYGPNSPFRRGVTLRPYQRAPGVGIPCWMPTERDPTGLRLGPSPRRGSGGLARTLEMAVRYPHVRNWLSAQIRAHRGGMGYDTRCAPMMSARPFLPSPRMHSEY